jgi:hypothetical protein
VVIDQINIGYVTVLEAKDNAPVSADSDAPKPDEVALQRVQPEARKVHILGPRRTVQKRKHAGDFIDVLGVQAAAVVVCVKAFQASVPKPSQHFTTVCKVIIVTCQVVFQKEKAWPYLMLVYFPWLGE